MNIEEVPLQHINQILPLAEGYISAALDYSCGDYTIDEARVFLASGAWSLIIAYSNPGEVRGALVVQYFNRPRDRVAFIIALGGRLVTAQENAQKLFDIFRRNGATTVEAGARDQVLRLWKKYGLGPKYTIISASI